MITKLTDVQQQFRDTWKAVETAERNVINCDEAYRLALDDKGLALREFRAAEVALKQAILSTSNTNQE